MSDRIYIVSDGTGQSAMSIMRAALLQFGKPDVKFTVYSMIDREDQLVSILNNAKIDSSFVAYTMVTREYRKLIKRYCDENGLMSVDLIGPPLDQLEGYLGKGQLEQPGLLRKVDEKYFKRIEAMEFTLTHDDGKTVKGIQEADLVILGLSRTSKTPTSFFLAQQGFKVVNIPLVPEIAIPEEVYSIEQHKIVLLVMDPEVLQKVRSARLRHYKTTSNYNNLPKIFAEVEFCYELIRKNRKWSMIDTTNKSIEETAREIIHTVYGRDMEL
jgi:regulator of PEP synthase PpsR (kinase-PPPase family)